MGSKMNRSGRLIVSIAILLAAFVLPMIAVHFTADPPKTRRIHVDLFRYGMVPSIIHVDRGDTVIFTFSSRDTPQSFFLQEYDLDVKVSPNTGEVEVVHPSDPHGEPETMREVVIHAGRPGLAGFFNTKSRYRGHVFSGPMHGFEQGFFVVHPNYIYPGVMGLLFAIPIVGLLNLKRRSCADAEPERRIDLFEKWPWFKSLLSIQGLQFWLMSIMGILMYVVVLICLLGTKMAGGNLGILLVWVVWLIALVLILVPLFGRSWCTMCPIPMVGDGLQRGATVTVREGKKGEYNNRFNGLWRRWPRRLDSAVSRTISFLCFGTVSVLIISQPRWTGWALVIFIGLGTILPLIFQHRAFCRYLCPINSFISLYARMARVALRKRLQKSCDHCIERDIVTCRRGNEYGWACPYGLTVPEIEENAECGLCLECLRSCRFNNVSILWRPFRLDRPLIGNDEALQAIVMMTLGIVYCILFQGPWYGLRDMIDLIDKKNWGLFVFYAAGLWLIALGLLPMLLRILTGLGGRLARITDRTADIYPGNVSPLVPMGLFIWIAFALPMLMTQGSFVLSTLSDPFGWGWDLFGTAGYPWIQLLPESIPWFQSAMVLIGFALAIRTSFRVWTGIAGETRGAILGMLPVGAFLFVLCAWMLWFFAA